MNQSPVIDSQLYPTIPIEYVDGLFIIGAAIALQLQVILKATRWTRNSVSAEVSRGKEISAYSYSHRISVKPIIDNQ